MRVATVVLFVLSLLVSRALHAENDKESPSKIEILSFTDYDFGSLCGVTLYGRSRHLHTKNKFNEQNTGLGLRCYKSTYGAGLSVNTGRLVNSLTGITDLVGFGYEFRTSQYYGVQLGAGIDVDYLWYRVPTFTRDGETRQGRTLTGVLPFPFLSLSYNNKATLQVHRLKTDIYLFSLAIKF